MAAARRLARSEVADARLGGRVARRRAGRVKRALLSLSVGE